MMVQFSRYINTYYLYFILIIINHQSINRLFTICCRDEPYTLDTRP